MKLPEACGFRNSIRDKEESTNDNFFGGVFPFFGSHLNRYMVYSEMHTLTTLLWGGGVMGLLCCRRCLFKVSG